MLYEVITRSELEAVEGEQSIINGNQLVITSYSIHYTKLYEELRVES